MKLVVLISCLVATTVGNSIPERKGYDEACYEGLGCFSTAPPFSSSNRRAFVPHSPEEIGTKFLLFTRKNRDQHQYLKYNDATGLKNSNFDGNKPTKFVIHGWNTDINKDPWPQNMARNFLDLEDANVIVVDWKNGAAHIHYGKSASDCRVVGAQIAQLFQWLTEQTSADASKLHIVGHSLGAHISGYAGERIPNLARITGLDPAGPYFANTSKEVRLDETDALFVDAVSFNT